VTGLPTQLPVLLVAVPLAGAALLAALGHWVPRMVADVTALVVATAAVGGAAWLTATVGAGRRVTWLGGWEPRSTASGRESVGIVLVADRWSAALALLAAVMVLAGLLFSWRYFEETSATYHALMLAFLAALSGFVLAGDLFDAFVWFELMGAAAYALAGMRVEEPRSVHAALEFGVVNTLGCSLSLIGITLLYARTGELNLALVGARLHGRPPDALVGLTFALLLVAALVKAAVVPFHFWTADAEAAAPTPVCAVLSGAMVATGVYAVARWWWVLYDGVLPAMLVKHLLLALGATTALLGALLCVGQRHVKRLLAYSTISHVGVAMLGVGLLGAPGLTAAFAYLLGHACTKGPLFLGTGVLLNQYGTVDEHALFGRARGHWLTLSVFLLGGLGLAGLPGLGLWWGKAALEHALVSEHLAWLVAVVIAAGVLTSGAVLRATVRIFLGLGADPRERTERSSSEHEEERGSMTHRIAALMLAPAWLLLTVGVGLAVVPMLHRAGEDAGAAFTGRQGYVAAVLGGRHSVTSGGHEALWTTSGLLLATLSLVLALGVAATGAWGSPLAHRRGMWALHRAAAALRAPHRADLTEQVAWLVAGSALLAVVLGR